MIEIKNLSKKIRKNDILTNVNMNLDYGNIYAFCGPNGSGKSVLLKLIVGIFTPTSGSILYDGCSYNINNIHKLNIRALINKPCFFPDLSGYENLKLLSKIQNKITDQDILEALKIVNLINEKDKKFSQYSLGMKQKLGIAQVLMEKPDIYLLDEPFNGIDRQSVKKICDELIKRSKNNKLIIFSSHIKEELDLLPCQIFNFENGNVLKYE